ncbi:MAG TPA: alpha-glucuronidase family glycosyl hydrolase, partial [bacterium]|nr:alpha-glucuronidase family glycosyl hydrolase [bacterium]
MKFLKAICLGLFSFLLCSQCNAAEFVVFQKDRPCSIVVKKSSQETMGKYAEELGKWLKEMTGAEFKLYPEEEIKNVTGAIIVGTSEDFPEKSQAEKLSDHGIEGFLIKSEKDRLWIIGNSELAVQHAIYSFLETTGCRWYFPDPVWYVIPQKKEIKIS